MEWHDLTDTRFTVSGLPWWEETRPKLIRFPESMRSELPKSEKLGEAAYGKGLQPSGARIRWRTDSRSLVVKARWSGAQSCYNLSRWAYCGIELWVDGEYWQARGPIDDQDYAVGFFDGLPATTRDFCLYAPCYATCEIPGIGMTDGAPILPPTPFALPLPVVFYGTSITQGGCAGRPSLAWPAMVARMLDVDFVNLGLSGAGRGEPEMARIVGSIPASLYVVDLGYNNPTPEEFAAMFPVFLDTLRPLVTAPVLVCSPTFSTLEVYSGERRLAPVREITRRECAARGLRLVEGYDLLGPNDRDGLCDHTHPNDIGMKYIAERLAPVVGEMIGCPVQS